MKNIFMSFKQQKNKNTVLYGELTCVSVKKNVYEHRFRIHDSQIM